MRLHDTARTFLFLGALASLCACSAVGDYARRQADRAALDLIAAKQTQALGHAEPFTIERQDDKATADLLAHARRLSLVDDAYSTPTYSVSLSDALAIAMANNRAYQSAREKLFSQALSLADVRWNYGLIFKAGSTLDETTVKTPNAAGGGSTVERFGSRGLSAAVSRQLATGGNITLAYTHQFIRYFTHAPRPEAGNALALQVVQPLLRGAGSLTAREGLLQPEREMIYAVRDFARYQQGFAIEVVGRYFDLLRGLDQMHNAFANYRSVMGNLSLLQIQLRHRICSQLDVDQALQKVLDAEAIWIDTRAAYGAQLDQFKIYLGVDLALDLGPDRRELADLQQKGMTRPDLSLAGAIEAGLAQRLDFINARDRAEDAARHVQIALRNFLPTLDASYNFTLANQKQHGMGLDFNQYQQNIGLDLGLPLDWTPRRDNYRQALLAADQAGRDMEQQHDALIAEVRDGWRGLERLRRKCEIAQQSVQLARRRVEGTQLMLASGQTTAREMANVQDEMLDAQNGLTAVLVDYTLCRLRFWYSIGRLDITS